MAGVPAVPVTVQLELTVSPDPLRLPENKAQVFGIVPPLVLIDWLYELPCVPAAIAPLVVTEGTGLTTIV